MKLSNRILILTSLLALTMSANAAIIYDANSTSVFSLTSAGGMAVSATSTVEAPVSATAGTGTASIDVDSQTAPGLFSGTDLTQVSELSGSASPSFGTSEATVLNSTLIRLDNSSGIAAATAEFEFSLKWLVEITQDDPFEAVFETGFATAFFHLSGFSPSGTETLMIDEGAGAVSVPDWLFEAEVSFDFSDISATMLLSGTKTVTAFVTVAAGSSDEFSVITDAFGMAAHIPVPEPTAVLLFILALAGFGHLIGKRTT